jgi:membrane protein
MNFLKRTLTSIDGYQRNHGVIGFPYAVIKKYGTDNASYQSALITYYALLSLFPLLIVFTTVVQLLFKGNQQLRVKISNSVAHYFPVIGNQLQQSVHSPAKAGLALAISLLVTFYGSRGVASAFQYALNSLWYVPRTSQPPFLKNIIRSLGILVAGGLGLIISVVLSGYTTFLGHLFIVKILATLISVIVLWATFILLFKLAIAGNKKIKNVLVGAAVAAIGLQILQIVGSALLSHEIHNFHSTYGTFALVIGLMFWLYLQAEVILYAVEVDVVKAYKLFPRSLQPPLTEGDKVAYTRSTKAQQQHKLENIDVSYSKN